MTTSWWRRVGHILGISFLILAFEKIEAQKAIQAQTPRILIHQRGHSTRLDVRSAHSKALLTGIEQALTSSSDMLKLSVIQNTIDQLRSKEISVEIIYPSIRTFVLPKTHKEIQADRLLVPITGEYTEAAPPKRYITFFYGIKRYASSPYANSDATYAQVVKLVKATGSDIK